MRQQAPISAEDAWVEQTETPEPLVGLFAKLGIPAQTYAHPPVFTVEQGVHIDALIEGGHTKNLFLKDKKDKLWLVTALDKTVIDLKWLSTRLNAARFSFGSAALLQDVLGVTPGSVTPLALINDKEKRVQPVLDYALTQHKVMNCHPLRNDRTTSLAPQDVLHFMTSLGYDVPVVEFIPATDYIKG